jgi:glutamyl-tRNA(Gln) amidotransferase subunit E
MRPRPGASRLYPETDLRPIRITPALMERASAIVPEPIEARVRRYMGYGMSRELAMQVVRSTQVELIDELIEEFRNSVPATTIANIFVNTLRALQREGVDVGSITGTHIRELLRALSGGIIVKEALQDVLREIARRPNSDVQSLIKELGLVRMSYDEVRRIVSEKLSRMAMITRDKAMGIIMRELRGRASPEDITKAIDEYLNQHHDEKG